jgi:UDP-N-acetylglucosamine 1-carboxyvinyltransferase
VAETFFRINGKNPISGTITPQGNKNEALPLLGAVCLVKADVILENVPMF